MSGHLYAVDAAVGKLTNASEIYFNLINYKCSVTQLKTFCDPDWKPYLKDCPQYFKKSVRRLRDAKKIVGRVIRELDKANEKH